MEILTNESCYLRDKKIIIFDLDGTIDGQIKVLTNGKTKVNNVNSRTIDNIIIDELFEKNKFINLIDSILWKINELDIISNNMWLFSLRIFIYSMFTGKKCKKSLEYYEKIYVELMKKYVVEKYNEEISNLRKLGFELMIFSQNIYTKALEEYIPIKAVANKRKHILKLSHETKIAYLVGNNYVDDICLAHKVGAEAIYVGKSKLLKFIAKKDLIVVENTTQAINEIFKREEPRK